MERSETALALGRRVLLQARPLAEHPPSRQRQRQRQRQRHRRVGLARAPLAQEVGLVQATLATVALEPEMEWHKERQWGKNSQGHYGATTNPP